MNIIKWGQKWWEPSTEHLGNSTVLVGAASGKLENYPVGKQENGRKDNTPPPTPHTHTFTFTLTPTEGNETQFQIEGVGLVHVVLVRYLQKNGNLDFIVLS